jgi:hypothetical protein
VLNGPGQPIDSAALSFFERRFGYDFSNVSVHTDCRAAESAAAIGAIAYTLGHEIVFASGRYDPTTHGGRKLLSHELAHVVQVGQHAQLANHVLRQVSPDVEPATTLSTSLTPDNETSPLAGVSPSSFSFHTVIPDDGTGVSGGWQETDCETIRFVGGFPFFPTKIDVQLRVGVPLRNQRQGIITPLRAQQESIDAANLAGTEVLALLLDGDISPSQISAYFINLMQTHLLIDGKRVTTCTGGSKKAALSFVMNDGGSFIGDSDSSSDVEPSDGDSGSSAAPA